MRIFLAILALCTATHAIAEWSVSVDRDPMTDAVESFATSEWTNPAEPISGIYSDLRVVLGFACSGGTEMVYMKFNQQINSSDALTRNGYNIIQAAVRWDQEKADHFQGNQKWGASSFTLMDSYVAKIQRHSTALFGLSWYNAGEVYFRFDLSGSSDAIARAKEVCSD